MDGFFYNLAYVIFYAENFNGFLWIGILRTLHSHYAAWVRIEHVTVMVRG